MPRRRRNPDGSLVVPLSPAQEAALAKGRATIAAKYGGGGSKESSAGSDALSLETPPARQGQRAGRRVETVAVSKATKKRAKASSRSSRSTQTGTASASSGSKTSSGPGLLERWFTET